MHGGNTVWSVLTVLLVLLVGLLPRATASTVTVTSSSLPASSSSEAPASLSSEAPASSSSEAPASSSSEAPPSSSSEAPALSSAFVTMSSVEGDSTLPTSEVTSPTSLTYDPSDYTNLTSTETTVSMFTSDNLTYSFDNETFENATTDDMANDTWADSTEETSTTTTATTTSYIIYCGGSTVIPAGINTITHIISYAAVQFSCLEGFRESGTGSKLQTCQKGAWSPLKPLECEPLNPTAAPTLSTTAAPHIESEKIAVLVVPKWLPVLAVFLFLVAVAAVVILLILAFYLYRRRYFARTSTVIRPQQQLLQSPPLDEKPKMSMPKEAETKQEAQPRRWWPWSGSPKKPPPGQFCLDGVALIRNGDHALLPVRRRF